MGLGSEAPSSKLCYEIDTGKGCSFLYFFYYYKSGK